jgi:peptidoglycan/xylan/chitin deacetylase (PgdA/CDA1 family)
VIPGRDQLKHLYFALLRALGSEGRLLRDIRANNRLVIINLHQVRPERNAFWSPLTPELFEELLAFVTPRFFVTTFAQATRNDTNRPTLILSFDDGYYDYLEYAAPLMRKYGVPSNQNVVARSVIDGQPPPIVRLCDFLGAAPRSLIDEIRLPGFTGRLSSGDDMDKVRYGNALCWFLKMRPQAEAAADWQAVNEIITQLDGFRASRMMTAPEIRQVAGEHEIGSHSFGHASMEFESDAYFEADTDRAEQFFRETLGLPMDVYAFPNGSARPSQVAALERRGVAHILLAGDKYARVGARVYERFNFYADSVSEVRLRALGYTPRGNARSARRMTS